MKKNYLDPEMELIRFQERDVISTSTPIGEGDGDLDSTIIGGDNGDF